MNWLRSFRGKGGPRGSASCEIQEIRVVKKRQAIAHERLAERLNFSFSSTVSSTPASLPAYL
jgi:hypothetical protein